MNKQKRDALDWLELFANCLATGMWVLGVVGLCWWWLA